MGCKCIKVGINGEIKGRKLHTKALRAVFSPVKLFLSLGGYGENNAFSSFV